MQFGKINILLLALLVAAMVIVPVVSAVEQPATNVENSDPFHDPEINAILNTAPSNEQLPSSLLNSVKSDPTKKNERTFLETYESPSKKIITLMKAKKYSDTQITALLNQNGYGWDARTGSSWKGSTPTVDEQKVIDLIRGPGYSPDWSSSQKNLSKTTMAGILSLNSAGALMMINDQNTYFGVNTYMSPGPLPVSSTGTFQHVVTTHVGKPASSGEDWTEAGATMSVNDPNPRYFTYDNDEGGWQFHGAAGTSQKNYQIYVSSTVESFTRNGQTVSGYVYNIWIDNSWVRSGHLLSRQTGINCANENWVQSGNSFSSESSHPTFQNGYLYKNSGYQLWGAYSGLQSNFNTWGSGHYTNAMSGGSYQFVSWVT
jgi:hypothetical protein